MAKVNVNFQIDKVMVAHENYDLFKKGFYSVEPHNNETLHNVIIPKAILTKPSGRSLSNWIDLTEWGFDLNCGYLGAGPRDLRDFISNNGYYQNDDLYKRIQSNNVVAYDFNANELETYNTISTFDHNPFHIKATKNGKFVFLLKFFGTHRFQSNKDQVISDIQKTVHFASHMFNTELQVIKYIGDTTSDMFYNHSTYSLDGHSKRNYYNLILDFDAFEIWIDYPFSMEQKNIQYDDEFRQILRELNYPLLNKRFDNNVLQAIDRFMREDKQTNQIIWVTYDESSSSKF